MISKKVKIPHNESCEGFFYLSLLKRKRIVFDMLFSFLTPPIKRQPISDDQIDATYKEHRLKIFIGIFIGYAGYYLVRKNFALAMPELLKQGFSKSELGFALSGVSIAYGISKFVMGNVSDRSNAKYFLPIGLILSCVIMSMMGFFSWATSSVGIMFTLLLLNGWFQGMGWPACGRIMVHWFSVAERGSKMALWNIAHNIGGGLVGLLAVFGFYFFNDWKSAFYLPAIFAFIIAVLAYFLLTDTPTSIGLPKIEIYKNEQQQTSLVEHTPKELFFKYIINNKSLWLLACANLFVYFIRYGVIDWAPTYLQEIKGFDKDSANWAFSAYEFAGIPGTLLCGWLSDKYFKNRRAPVSIIYIILVLIALLIYWLNPVGNRLIDTIALIAIGFLIYGPVMLIGVQALDISHKKAAGTAAGLTGLFGYLGGAVLANSLLGIIFDHFSWDGGFILLIISGIISILFLIMTDKKIKPNTKKNIFVSFF